MAAFRLSTPHPSRGRWAGPARDGAAMAGLRSISRTTRRIGTRALAPLLAVFAALVYLAPAVDTPFYTKGEAREAVLVQAMRAEGNFVLPLRNGSEIPSKPPLFHWLAAAAAAIAARLKRSASSGIRASRTATIVMDGTRIFLLPY